MERSNFGGEIVEECNAYRKLPEGSSAGAPVYYPGLSSHPSHEIAASQIDGLAGWFPFR
jgi:cystathionine beta-lyase/cystathionine gamma-synthase